MKRQLLFGRNFVHALIGFGLAILFRDRITNIQAQDKTPQPASASRAPAIRVPTAFTWMKRALLSRQRKP